MKIERLYPPISGPLLVRYILVSENKKEQEILDELYSFLKGSNCKLDWVSTDSNRSKLELKLSEKETK